MSDTAADILLAARQRGETLDELPAACRPSDIEAGYVAQAELTAVMGTPMGWKVGCTNTAAMDKMGTDEPFAGPLFEAMLYPSPAELETSAFNKRLVEGEFAFRLGKDLPPVPGGYADDQIKAAVAALHPAIEIADCRFNDILAVGVPSLLADGALNGAFVFTEGIRDWHEIDLVNAPVRMLANGDVVGEGTGAAALGDPFRALAWFVNKWSALGWPLAAGQFITTGTCTGAYMAVAGDVLRADFGELGRVELRFN